MMHVSGNIIMTMTKDDEFLNLGDSSHVYHDFIERFRDMRVNRASGARILNQSYPLDL